jgi:flagellar basal body-associated protein FliL
MEKNKQTIKISLVTVIVSIIIFVLTIFTMTYVGYYLGKNAGQNNFENQKAYRQETKIAPHEACKNEEQKCPVIDTGSGNIILENQINK